MLSDDLSLMEVLGEGISEQCIQFLAEECLSESIPTSREDLTEYNDFLGELSELDQYLKSLGFLNHESTRLQDYYSSNIDVTPMFTFAYICSKYRP